MESASQSDDGYLQPPNDTTAIYAFNGNGPTTISATWSPQAELTLTATCANNTQSAQGSGSVDLTLSDAQGACQVTLTEPTDDTADVIFTLIIDPSNHD
jgi:hypothetical protein